MEGRQIQDASLIANEVIDSMVRRKEKGILCKLDIEKAYNQLNWKFLPMVLKEMGFGNKSIGWIQLCISTTSFSIIIKRSPASFFKSSRGLRQGDPLSPYLLVLEMEVFSILIDKAKMGGFFTCYNIWGRNGVSMNIAHFLFADDTMIFYKDSEEQMVFLSWTLLCFEALSRLRVNLEKSVILPVGDVENID